MKVTFTETREYTIILGGEEPPTTDQDVRELLRALPLAPTATERRAARHRKLIKVE